MRMWVQWSGHTDYVARILQEFVNQGHTIYDKPNNDCDFFLSLQMGNFAACANLAKISNIPYYNFVWDAYECLPKGYDWDGCGQLCHAAKEVWTPSTGQSKRITEHWGVDPSKTYEIPAYGQFFEYDDVKDGNYVCDPLRLIPDRHEGWISKACSELGIPYKHGGRGRGQLGKSWEDYQKFIAEASFLVCPWWEMSTGGMSLYEGYNLGKEVLFCNSPYMGGKDWFGDRAHYFEPTYDSLKAKIKEMWDNKNTFPTRTREEKSKWVKENFSVQKFVERAIARVQYHNEQG
jgi:hypothetical protein